MSFLYDHSGYSVQCLENHIQSCSSYVSHPADELYLQIHRITEVRHTECQLHVVFKHHHAQIMVESITYRWLLKPFCERCSLLCLRIRRIKIKDSIDTKNVLAHRTAV